jgi:hypothetical protein
MDKLKLFVLGVSSDDPDKWSPWGSRAIVIAHDADEARSLIGDLPCSGVTEIDLSKPRMLLYEPPGPDNL